MMQPARTNRVRPLLVFLNLLKCNSQGVAEFRLAHIKHGPPHADAVADVLVDGVRGFGSGHGTIAALYDITARADRARKRHRRLEIRDRDAVARRTLLADMGRGMIRCVASIIGSPIMKLKLVLAISALATMPAFAQPQQGGTPPTAPKPTLAQVQKVIQIITGDRGKTEQYCDIEKLALQIAEAEQKQDTKRVEELTKQVDELEIKIGPEYVALMDGLPQIDENSIEAKQIEAALGSLEKLCR
jgi:hypothetical protein